MAESILEGAKRADAFFMQRSPIHEAMRRLAKALTKMQIPFAIAGAMAANAHGHQQTTADVDILIRLDDLQRFKERYVGRGWVDKFEGSKNFYDAVLDVKIVVLLAGSFPGDRLPKPVVFPEPESVAEFLEEAIPFVSLKSLLELNLASGMTAAHRPRDLDDVIQLIKAKANQLSFDYADQLNPFVQDKFRELWHSAQVVDEY